jgi:hypothetical protein
MHFRVILSGFIVLAFVAEAAAQNRVRWRPGSILGGLRNRVQAARQDSSDQQPTLAPVEGAPAGWTDDEYRSAMPRSGQSYRAQPPLSLPSPPTRPTQPSYPAPPVRQPQPQASLAVSINDVIELVQRGLGESTIVRYIGDNGAKQRLEIADLIRLHEEGVSEPIINAMQTAKVVPAESRRDTTLPPVDSLPTDPDAVFPEPPRRTVNGIGFGPSILEPPGRPAP